MFQVRKRSSGSDLDAIAQELDWRKADDLITLLSDEHLPESARFPKWLMKLLIRLQINEK